MMIDPWLVTQYSRLRAERGWTWEELAGQFDRAGSARMAAWARSLVDPDPVPVRAPRLTREATR